MVNSRVRKKLVNWFHIWIVVPTKKKYEQVILCPHNLQCFCHFLSLHHFNGLNY